MDLLQNLIKLVRAYEWVDKLQIIFIAAFIIMVYLPHPKQYLNQIIVLGGYIIFLGSYGYVINSYGDREQDAKVGKHPEVAYFSDRQLQMLLVFLAIWSIGIPLYFGDIKVKILGIMNFLLVTFYSIKPIRLKERGFLGVITAMITQRPLPFLLFAFLVPYNNQYLVYYLFVWLCIIGISIMLTHQFSDFVNDEKAGVDTLATRIGKSKIKKWIKLVLIIMLLYALIPIFILPLYDGFAISLVILAFSGFAIGYSVESLRTP